MFKTTALYFRDQLVIAGLMPAKIVIFGIKTITLLGGAPHNIYKLPVKSMSNFDRPSMFSSESSLATSNTS